MYRSVQYFFVCTHLTALTQRMRNTWPRNWRRFTRDALQDNLELERAAFILAA
jgi:hypothetical protein